MTELILRRGNADWKYVIFSGENHLNLVDKMVLTVIFRILKKPNLADGGSFLKGYLWCFSLFFQRIEKIFSNCVQWYECWSTHKNLTCLFLAYCARLGDINFSYHTCKAVKNGLENATWMHMRKLLTLQM